MWKEILEYTNRVINLSQKQKQHEEDIKSLRQEMKALTMRVDQLTDAVQQIAFELRRTQEVSAKDRENLLLRMELALLKSGRELPPASPSHTGTLPE